VPNSAFCLPDVRSQFTRTGFAGCRDWAKAISVKETSVLLVFLFRFGVRQPLHSSLCACCRALKRNKNSAQSGIFFSGNHLSFVSSFCSINSEVSNAVENG
jgi:hypothetical protein